MYSPRIAIAEWFEGGHHETFLSHAILALEEINADVLTICLRPDQIRENVEKLRRSYGLGSCRSMQTTYFKIEHQRKRFHGIRPARISSMDWSFRHFRYIEGLVNKWENKKQGSIDLIFYACVADWEFEWMQYIQPFLRYPWAGQYLHAWSLRMPGKKMPLSGRLPCPEKIFRGHLCKGVAILDEYRVNQFSEITAKPTIVFPDLTEERLLSPTNESGIAKRLNKFSEGRPLIGSFGVLQKSKGILPLAAVAQDPRMNDLRFAFAGEVKWDSLNARESEEFINIITNADNIWSHLLRIPDEAVMNSLFKVCDVIYAAYVDFPHSSNILTKAAYLKKPIIVSDGYIMADRVREFSLGEVVPQGDTDAIANAILKITRDPVAWVNEHKPRWSDFCDIHSFESLKKSFSKLIKNN